MAPEARTITFGVILIGDGKVWLDDVRIEAVGKDVPSTDLLGHEQKGEVRHAIGVNPPTNLDFEEGIGAPGLNGTAATTAPLTTEQTQWLRTRTSSRSRRPSPAGASPTSGRSSR